MDRLLGGFNAESWGRSVDGFGTTSFRRSLVWTTPPPHMSTRSCTELCLPLCLGPDAFSTDLDALNPTTSSGLSSSLEDIFPSREDPNVGCVLRSSEEEDRSKEERAADPVVGSWPMFKERVDGAVGGRPGSMGFLWLEARLILCLRSLDFELRGFLLVGEGDIDVRMKCSGDCWPVIASCGDCRWTLFSSTNEERLCVNSRNTGVSG